MASRKYKPTLIELINKKESLSPPNWFYGGRKAKIQEQAKQEQEAKVKVTEPPAAKAPESEVPEPKPAMWRREMWGKWLEWKEGRFKFSIPNWVLPLVILGLILSFLIVYRLGQSSGANEVGEGTNEFKNRPPAQELEEVASGPVRPGLVSAPKEEVGQAVASRAAEAGLVDRIEENEKADVQPVRAATGMVVGQCLVICGHEDKSMLLPIQRYFNSKGMATVIGQTGGRWVLVSVNTFESIRSDQASKLKQRASELGGSYERNRPAGSASFASAFRSMYWMNADKIRF